SAVENVVEQQDVPASHVRLRNLPEDYFAAGLQSAMVTGDAQTIEAQRQGNAPQQIGHEHEAAIENRDHRQLAVAIVCRNLGCNLIQSLHDRRLVEKHALEVVLHCRNSTPFHYCHVERSRDISDCFSRSLETRQTLLEHRLENLCAAPGSRPVFLLTLLQRSAKILFASSSVSLLPISSHWPVI